MPLHTYYIPGISKLFTCNNSFNSHNSKVRRIITQGREGRGRGEREIERGFPCYFWSAKGSERNQGKRTKECSQWRKTFRWVLSIIPITWNVEDQLGKEPTKQGLLVKLSRWFYMEGSGWSSWLHDEKPTWTTHIELHPSSTHCPPPNQAIGGTKSNHRDPREGQCLRENSICNFYWATWEFRDKWQGPRTRAISKVVFLCK